MLSGTSEYLLNVIESIIPGNISYNAEGVQLDLHFGDIDIGNDVQEILDLKGLTKITRYPEDKISTRDETETTPSFRTREIEQESGKSTHTMETELAKIPSDSIDVVTMFYGLHHLSDDYLSVMNSLARVTKSGALMIMTGLNIDNHEDADELEFNYFASSAGSGRDYTDMYRRSKRSYTRIQETIESFTTFGFYLLLIVGEVEVVNGYMAIFRKSSAPDRSYIPVYTHPVYSVLASNIHEMLETDEDDETLYQKYMNSEGISV